MTQALLTQGSQYSPTPLQRAAIRRIRELTKELAGYGMFPRTSMELEFFVENVKGAHIPGVIKLDKAFQFLEQEKITMLDKVEIEGEPRRQKREDLAVQYEVTLDDRLGLLPTKRGNAPTFHPEMLAFEVLRLKQGSLHRLLQNTTSLQPVAGLGILGNLQPNFDARPYHTHDKQHSSTSGLHVNVSLIDRQGNNLFARSLPMLYHCADGVAHAQHVAQLAFMPNDNSHKRIGANTSSPGGVGVLLGQPVGYVTHNSTQIRGLYFDILEANPKGTQYTRIENRLPGADADPFVAMAATLGGIVLALRKHVEITAVHGEKRMRVKCKPAERPVALKLNLNSKIEDSRTAFAKSADEREVLGAELFEAVKREYGAQNAR
jgi:hypothetical protein